MLMLVDTRSGGPAADDFDVSCWSEKEGCEVEAEEVAAADFFFRFFFPSPLPICSVVAVIVLWRFRNVTLY